MNLSLQAITQRLRLVIAIGKISKAKQDTIQGKFLSDEILEYKTVQPYGLSHYPTSGNIIALCRNGNRKNGHIICVYEDQKPIKLEKDEVALYSKFNNKIHMYKNGLIGIQNNQENLANVLKDLITEIENIQTFGNSVTQQIHPVTKPKLDQIKQRIAKLLK